MAKRCIKPDCSGIVAFACECKGKPIFMCKKHPSVHLMSKGNHQIIGFRYKPDNQEADKISKQFLSVLTKIRKIQTQTLDNTKKIIEQTLQLSDKLMKYLEVIENRFLKVYNSVKMRKSNDIQDVDDYINFAYLDESLILKSVDAVVECLTSFYDIDPCMSIAQVIFCNTSKNSQLSVLNLENLISYPLSLKDEKGSTQNLNINNGFPQCQVKKHTNCIINASNAYLIDMKRNIVESLPGITNLNTICGLVCKDDYIYVFQGINNNQLSYKLKLGSAKWESFSYIPSKSSEMLNPKFPFCNTNSYYNENVFFCENKNICFGMPAQNNYIINGTASIIRNNIVIGSYYMSGIYHYNEISNSYTQILTEISNSYTQILNLTANTYNYAMENWIVSRYGLYENIGPALSDFKNYQCASGISNLSFYGSFPHKGCIYFMLNDNSLMRINCDQKKIEAVQFNFKAN
ncbi:hypothetical protein SteCoe_34681 [Stentor coeruleus]|uniref:Uncharacterized protein n=1 Tax=Stentor coeruleus TaxID=5963 RepID=A0A1R2ATY9_9CILI|nr:hypothetical protein SteCoe_34681 [Stentor coeruleus]